MKIIIPMAGKGSRFTQEGYKKAKPLLKFAGKHMIEWPIESIQRMLGARNSNFIFIMLQEHNKKYSIGEKMQEFVPGARQMFIEQVTGGAAETVYLAKDLVDPEEELLITDCDQYFIVDKFQKARKRALKNQFTGIIAVQKANNPGYSYIELDKEGFIKRTAEKELISNLASIGLYYYTKAKYFMESVEKMIQEKNHAKGEYYVCPTYNEVIKNGRAIVVEADFWMTLGTPDEARKFEEYMIGKK